ncbi:bi-domain-containing oxidoreductase [Verrucomicrobiota bacterium]
MKQLIQKLGSGEMKVSEVPTPLCGAGMVLARNHYSFVSPGTESSTVRAARSSLVSKAKQRPEQVRKVIDVVQKQGPVQAYRAVMKKLDAYSPLGYSSAGTVIEVGESVQGFAPGDRVACSGAGYANHAEVVAAPANLCVRLAPDADLRMAACNTLGAIAMQGVRQADLRLGESCAVIGLGLLGQIACLLLKASGVRVVGIDLDEWTAETAGRHAAHAAYTADTPGLSEKITEFSGAMGVDAVVIAAGSSSLEPINFAGEICRKKGRVVVVGVVPTGFDRDGYYRKELDLRMSCSYGPGRYDPTYEEGGADYPYAYVRWTENRNMRAFQDLLHRGRIDIDFLLTHEFALEEAPKAYDMVLERAEPYLGILIKYDAAAELGRGPVQVTSVPAAGKVTLAFIGAGSYAQSHLLPNLPGRPDVVRKTVMTASGTTSKRVAERYRFGSCTSDEANIFGDESINTVFIATRHNTHAEYVIKALEAGKHVFCEKPLCITEPQLTGIQSAVGGHQSSILLVGFNRRFAPLAVKLKERLGDAPMAMLCRINAGAIPADSWIQDSEVGGGRIVGEVCHFVDLLTFLCGSVPVRVHAGRMESPQNTDDTLTANLEFANGSVGSICYFANGASTVTKEHIEVFSSGMIGMIHDFKSLEIHAGKRPERKKLVAQDKGQKNMVESFIGRIADGGEPLIPFEEIVAVTKATFAIQESIRTRQAVEL